MSLMTPAEAAKHLAISTRQLRDLTQNGSIRYVNIGQRDRETRRYHPSDLEAFIEERRCLYSSAPARRTIPTTSVFGVSDFQALLSARKSGTRKGSKRALSEPPKPIGSTPQSP